MCVVSKEAEKTHFNLKGYKKLKANPSYPNKSQPQGEGHKPLHLSNEPKIFGSFLIP